MRKTHVLIWILYFLLLVKVSSAVLIINEIMYDPAGGYDDDLEWVEIYNNSTEEVNLSAWKINSKDLDNILIGANSYLVIAREILDDDGDGINFESVYGNNDSIFNFMDNLTVVQASIVLNNNYGEINLSDGSLEFLVDYNSSAGGSNNGRSIELFEGRFVESYVMYGTPGMQNSIFLLPNITENISSNESSINISGLRISVILNGTVYKGVRYTSLFRIDNLAHLSGITEHINLTVSYNISGIFSGNFYVENLNSYITANTGDVIFNQTGNFTLCGEIILSTAIDDNKGDDTSCAQISVEEINSVNCDISIGIETDRQVYDNGTIQILNIVNLSSYPFIIEYWIEDAFGNLIKSKINTTNTDKKQYTPNINERIAVYLVKNKLYAMCNDLNLSNNEAERLIVVRNIMGNNDASSEVEESEITIKSVSSPNKLSHGETLMTRINIYKGNTGKSSVRLWMEGSGRISEVASVNLFDKFTIYEFALPVKLKEECSIKSGSYKLVAEGLDAKDKKSIELDFDDCKEDIPKLKTNKRVSNSTKNVKQNSSTKKNTANKNAVKGRINDRILMAGTNLTVPNNQAKYKSSNERIREMIPWLIAVITTMISIAIIWKR